MVWPAPMSRSSGGRSAVRTIIGTPASSASTTAGCRFAAAEPDVQSTAAGTPVASAVPSAKNPALRSSRITVTSIAGSRQSATARGVEREPGETTARRTPQRVSSSTIADASAVFRLVGSTSLDGSSADPVGRKGLFVDLDAEAGIVPDDQTVPLGADSGPNRRREQPLRRQPVGDAGIPAARAERLDRVRRSRDPDRSLERARQIGRQHLSDLERSSDTPDFGDLDRGDLARAELTRPAGVEG